ncbi:transglycosylase family protein [Streptomyces sp. NPDC047097]|uniref:transglycosylase family protein n=1 Tax=Streptomyces sp. NPDC047097 TaxID=3155260 RepID=UPI00340A73C9
MTGSAIALPLLGAGTATAADAATWDRVAECESGGMWSADLGNGFYGGLQMSQETWESHGGLAHAARPDLASRSQQIAVAEKVYAAGGAAAWQTCAPIAGLGEDDASRNPAPSPSAGDTDGEPATSAETPHGERDAAPPTTGSASRDADRSEIEPEAPEKTDAADARASASTTADPEASASGTGKHRGKPAPEEEPATEPSADPSASTGADPAGEAGRDQQPAATGPGLPGDEETAAEGTEGEREGEARTSRGEGAERGSVGTDPGAYTVQPGDNLTAIAQERELDGGWTALYEANKDTVGTDPDLILPGQDLQLTEDQK